ncbi:hypothetical protein [Mycobacteroides immunogenum]|nr:hypothetical protein [Mycobacteroides immunogenum]
MSDTYTSRDIANDNRMVAKSLVVCGATTGAVAALGWLIEAFLL